MTLMDTAQLLGNFGEFVGAIAVVCTLAYLAVQVGHSRRSLDENTRALEEERKLTRESMLSQLVQRWDEVTRYGSENREVASVFMRGNANPDDLDDVDRQIYESRIGLHFDTYFMFHRMTEAGFLDPDILRFSDRTFQTWGTSKGARMHWQKYRTLWPDNLREHVDGLLDESAEVNE